MAEEPVNILATAISCMDGGITSAKESADNSELLAAADVIVQDFRKAFGIQPGESLENSEAWESSNDEMLEAYQNAEYTLLLNAWEHIKVLMLECGMGDAVNEVLTKAVTEKFAIRNSKP